jgi:isoquinoline 1-oxidoreductase beta subunit
VKVHDFWTVIDPGFAVQPENIRAQVEGGVVYALGSVLFERISIKDGAVEQSNFHDYRLPRMGDIPEIHVEIISDPNAAPLGIGEQTVVTVAPAICNAVTAAIGKRPRHLPLTPERVLDLMRT